MQDTDRPASYDDLSAVIGFFLKRWFILAAAALIGLSAGFAVFLLSKQTFIAQQQFVLEGVVNQSQTVQLGAAATSPASLVATQQGILQGDALRASVERALGRAVAPLAVSTTDSSLSYTIVVAGSSPAQARSSLTAYTNAYESYLRTEGSAQIAEQTSLTRGRIDELEREIRTAKENEALTPTLNDQLNTQQAVLAQLQLQAVTGTTVVSRVGDAVVPSAATSPSALSLALIGAALAVFVAAVGTVLWSRVRYAARLTSPHREVEGETLDPDPRAVLGSHSTPSLRPELGEAP